MAARRAVRPAGAQVLHLRPDVLAAGLHLPHLAADHRGAEPVLLHRVAGRLWCGYACPQTVWTEVFLWMERITEGDRAAHEARCRALERSRNWRARAKQALWITFALWTGFTFVGFFTPIRDLGARVLRLRSRALGDLLVLFYGFATYGNAGLLREQVCKYMCPYARFQSAMFDRDT
jgi:polyferredoxin